MKKFFNSILNFFQKNGLIKVIIAFIIFSVCGIVINRTENNVIENIFAVIGIIAIAYVLIVFLIFLIFAFINTIKDIINRWKR